MYGWWLEEINKWMDQITNKVLKMDCGKRPLLFVVYRWKINSMGHILRGNGLLTSIN